MKEWLGEDSAFQETRIDGEVLYEGRIVTLRVDRVCLPSGKEARREVVEHAPAAVILAENTAGELLFIRQFRYPIGKVILEIPAGLVEEGENPAEAAVRELQEETGWKPGRIKEVFRFYPAVGFCNEELILYHATDLTASKLAEDPDECIEPQFLPLSRVRELLDAKEICDGKTLLAVYWYLAQKRCAPLS